MKVEYKVLWIDDLIDEFEEEGCINAISEHLEEEGFKPIIITSSKPDVFFDNLDDSFDLILTDYHMGETNGENIINKIRELSIFTEILFYTAKADLKDIEKINRISFLQTSGDSRGHYKAVEEETIKLIDLTVKKFQNIIAMRGMIMHETSYLDNQSLHIIETYINNRECKEMADTVFTKLSSQLNEKLKKTEECKATKNLKKLSKDNFLFSAEYKIDALSYINKDVGLTDFSIDYKNEINNVRNKFAHAVLLKDDNGREFFKSGEDGMTFDKELCKKIRKNINKHKDNLDELNSRIENTFKAAGLKK